MRVLIEVTHTMKQKIGFKINEACERKSTKTKNCRLIQGTMHHHPLTEIGYDVEHHCTKSNNGK